jgi:lipoprotein signal peptidase
LSFFVIIFLLFCAPQFEKDVSRQKSYFVYTYNTGCRSGFKDWVKTTMTIGEEINLFGNWGKLHFIENNGMAFGMEMVVELES